MAAMGRSGTDGPDDARGRRAESELRPLVSGGLRTTAWVVRRQALSLRTAPQKGARLRGRICCTAQPLPSGSLKNTNEPHG